MHAHGSALAEKFVHITYYSFPSQGERLLCQKLPLGPRNCFLDFASCTAKETVINKNDSVYVKLPIVTIIPHFTFHLIPPFHLIGEVAFISPIL